MARYYESQGSGADPQTLEEEQHAGRKSLYLIIIPQAEAEHERSLAPPASGEEAPAPLLQGYERGKSFFLAEALNDAEAMELVPEAHRSQAEVIRLERTGEEDERGILGSPYGSATMGQSGMPKAYAQEDLAVREGGIAPGEGEEQTRQFSSQPPMFPKGRNQGHVSPGVPQEEHGWSGQRGGIQQPGQHPAAGNPETELPETPETDLREDRNRPVRPRTPLKEKK